MTEPMTATADSHPVFAAGILRGLHLLEADAGTGKTWTLTGLVVRAIVEQGLPIRSILAVTFTTAAVAELKARVRGRLAQSIAGLQSLSSPVLVKQAKARQGEARGEYLNAEDPFVSDYIRRLCNGEVLDESGTPLSAELALSRLRLAMAGADEMAVLTLHGFCQRLLASQPLSSRAPMLLEPSADSGKGIERGVRQWWREALGSRSLDDVWLLSMLSLRIGRLISAVTLRLADPLARIAGVTPDWREALARAVVFRQRLREAIGQEAEQFVGWYGGGVKGPARLPGNRVKGPRARAHLDMLLRFANGAVIDKWPDDAIGYFTSEKIRELGGNLDLLSRTTLVPLCDELSAWYIEALNPCFAAIVEEAAQFVSTSRAEQLFRSHKVSFDDLIRLTHEALCDPGNGTRLSAGVRENFPLALVDECQDTDPMQWSVLQKVWPAESLAAGCALVLVGDPKQSIYRFRGADLYAYLDARRSWGQPARSAVPLRPTLWRLDENQRSDAGLLAAVSSLFAPQASFLVDDIEFQPARVGTKPRQSFEDGRNPAAQGLCWIHWTYDAVMDRRVLAWACALEIKSLLTDPKVRLDGRALQARDIAVLVGSHDEGREVKQQLRRLGLAAAETSREQVMNSVEAWEILRVIAAVADPADTRLVRGALVTAALGVPFGGLETVPAEQLLLFEQARLAWPRLGPMAALALIFDAFDTATRLAASDGAERSLTNHVHVLDLLATATQARGSAAAALRWLQRVIEQGRAVEGAAEELELRLESDANLVRILTIHKSKGLEFPVVFVPFAWRGRASRKQALVRFYARGDADGHWQRLIDAGFEASEAAKSAREREDLAERIRLLYVAMTRARHRCYVVRPAVQGNADSGSALDYLLSLFDSGTAPLGQVIDIQTLLDAPVNDSRSISTDSSAIRLARFDRQLYRSWQNTSFTALLAAAENDDRETGATVRDQDQWVVMRPDQAQTAVSQNTVANPAADLSPANIRHQFPAGAQAGTCLHRILEQTRLCSPVSPELVRRELLAHGFAGQSAPALAVWLDEVLAAPLPGLGRPLNSLGDSDYKVELEFQIKVEHLSLAAFVERIGRSEPIDLAGSDHAIRGYLNGFIDLVFRHAGRYYVLDWKSNRLGDQTADYSRAALVDAVRSNGYALQYSIYQLALHRYLRQQLRGYEPARHLGGVFYLFLRGVAAADSSVKAGSASARAGVFFRPADVTLVESLDELAGGVAFPQQEAR